MFGNSLSREDSPCKLQGGTLVVRPTALPFCCMGETGPASQLPGPQEEAATSRSPADLISGLHVTSPYVRSNGLLDRDASTNWARVYTQHALAVSVSKCC